MGASHSLESDTPADEQAERPSTASLAGPSTTAYDDGAGVHPRSVRKSSPPAVPDPVAAACDGLFQALQASAQRSWPELC